MALTEQELRSLDYEPDTGGHFGDYGGRYVSETLMAALSELDQNYQKLKNDPNFQGEFDADLASRRTMHHLYESTPTTTANSNLPS